MTLPAPSSPRDGRLARTGANHPPAEQYCPLRPAIGPESASDSAAAPYMAAGFGRQDSGRVSIKARNTPSMQRMAQ